MTPTLRALIPHPTRSRATVLALALVAVCLPPAIRFVTAPLAATLHVRWQPSVDAAARQQLETRFRLADGRLLDEDTWRYALRDTSRNNIRALVLDPAVADTHYIDRSTYALDRSAPIAARRTRFPTANILIRVVDWTAVILMAYAALLLSGRFPAWMSAWPRLSHGFRHLGEAARRVIAAIGRWLAPWIPELDARALGVFRVALGVGFLWIAWTTVVVPVPFERLQHRAWIDLDVVHQIAATPRACDALEIVMLVAALLFTVGVSTRPAYATFVATFFLATLIQLEASSSHDLGLPLVTFIGWLTVPWDRGLARRSSRADEPSRAFGFAIWWPGLTLGLALLAAAYAKLHQSGLAWITGGAVKYHFVTDAGNTVVDWGLWVASHEWAAVLISLAAIVIEAALILNVFARGPWMRLAAGAAGAGLFAGLYLFQGIYWRPWLVLLLAFLPWAWLNRVSRSPASAAGPTSLRTPQLVAVAIFATAQVYASASRIEAEPLLSNFPMYASTYASPEDFERSIRWELTRLVEARADGQDIAQALDDLRADDRFLLMELAEQGLPQAERLTEDEERRRGRLCEGYLRAMGALPTEVTFTLERRGFDWQAGGFRKYRPLATFPVPLAAVCHRLPR